MRADAVIDCDVPHMQAWGMIESKLDGPGVYLAASSADIPRAERWRAQLIEVGVPVHATWIDNIKTVGHANPPDASNDSRRAWSTACLAGIQRSAVLWVLVPEPPILTIGAWVELGCAYTLAKPIVLSGPSKMTIYGALGIEIDNDDDAFGVVRALVADATGESMAL